MSNITFIVGGMNDRSLMGLHVIEALNIARRAWWESKAEEITHTRGKMRENMGKTEQISNKYRHL